MQQEEPLLEDVGHAHPLTLAIGEEERRVTLSGDFLRVKSADGPFELSFGQGKRAFECEAGKKFRLRRGNFYRLFLTNRHTAANAIVLEYGRGIEIDDDGTHIRGTLNVSEASTDHVSYPALLLVATTKTLVLAANPLRRNALLRLPEEADGPALIGDTNISLATATGDLLEPGGSLPWPSKGAVYAVTSGASCRIFRTEFVD